ncbi:MAG: adenylate/guanylate cyclase domain-containing protein [Acidobacteriota bacterium]
MYLLRYVDAEVEKTHLLKGGVLNIGRLPTCGLVLGAVSVSRRHAAIRVDDTGRCWFKDLGSRYGSFRNQTRVLIEDVELAPGDTIRLGDQALTLEQHVSERELLDESHEVSEGPGTILRKAEPVVSGGDSHLVRLLSDAGRALLGSQTLIEMLNRVVEIAFDVVPAERAFLLLRDSPEAELTARVLRQRDGTAPKNPSLSRTVVRRVLTERVAILAADASKDAQHGLSESILKLSIRSFMCAPLWKGGDVIGVLYVDSSKATRFGSADLDAFSALANAAAVAIEQARLSTQLLEETKRRERLARYHSPAVVSRIIHDPGNGGMTAQEREVSVMFCDLVGFTTMCEKLPPAQSASILNAFLTKMTDVVFDHDGTLDKFLGDALLAVFGAPFDQPDHALKSVRAALDMRRALAELNAQSGLAPLQVRIAINTGLGITGDIGSPRRREFTVLGDVVNTASRLESQVTGPGEIVIAGSTYEAVKAHVTVRSLGSKMLRGRVTPIDVYAVEG